MDELFPVLFQAQAAARYAADQTGRSPYPYLAAVSENVDPEGQRRIKVTDPVTPKLETYWLRRLVSYRSYDPPLPLIGSTVLVLCVEGDPLNGWYLQCENLTNPPADKLRAIEDFHKRIDGDEEELTGGDRTIDVGKSLKLQTTSGASILLSENGNVIIEDGSGNKISLSGGIAIAASSLTVGGKAITTVGAKDTGGDSLVDRGW